MQFKAIKSFLNSSGLADVEKFVTGRFNSDANVLQDISHYLFSSGGKRIRPAICLECAHSLGLKSPTDKLIRAAAGIELIHMATLLHDDIIDKAQRRRNVDSAFVKYGLINTLLAGDFLLVRAFSLCSELDKFIIEETEKSCIELVEGEALETPLWQEEHTITSSIKIARKKTASLFRLASVCGSFFAGADEKMVLEFARFGEELGISFQILDDILDVVSDKETLGKSPGTDLREHKPSIINVLWLESGSKLSRELLSKTTSKNFVKKALAEVRSSEIIFRAKDIALQYSERAKNTLQRLNVGSDSSLYHLADLVSSRIN